MREEAIGNTPPVWAVSAEAAIPAVDDAWIVSPSAESVHGAGAGLDCLEGIQPGPHACRL